MRAFAIFLTVFGIGCALAGCLHLIFGPGADVMLGAELGAAVHDPVLDSQNRFYGAVFAGFGLLFVLAATDLARYRLLITSLTLIFFAGALARCVAWYSSGFPGNWASVLLLSELLLPPIILAWQHALKNLTGGYSN